MRSVVLATALAVAAAASLKPAAPRPHLIFVMSDDQGWSNSGFNNNRLLTPHTNALVKDGVRLDRHYVYKFCSPSRCSMLSGRLPIHVNQENSATEQPDAGIPLNMTAFPARLREVGYQTHQIGKWHAGQASPAHIPTGEHRGFDTALSFFNFGEDHYTQIRGGQALADVVDLGSDGGICPNAVDLYASHSPAFGKNGTYGGYTFTAEAVQRIEAHDPAVPLFMYIAFQNLHPPLQVPREYIDRYASAEDRTTINGMAAFLDESIGNVTAALKRTGLWENTLLVYSPDNGGYQGNGGDDTPLRGGKFSDFEGGTRVAAFASGGFLPEPMRGTAVKGMIHVADWYATFCALAGVEDITDVRAAAAGLPPLDSQDISALILGTNATSPRMEIVLSAFNPALKDGPLDGPRYFGKGEAVVSGPDADGKFWKLIVGTQLSGPFGDERSNLCKEGGPPPHGWINKTGFACNEGKVKPIEDGILKNVTTFEECVEACAARFPECIECGHNPGSKKCFLYNTSKMPGHNANWNCGYYIAPDPEPHPANSSWGPTNTGVDCTCGVTGCLYELISDENEARNIAADHPDVVQRLGQLLDEARATVYAPNRGVPDPAACDANDRNGGFWSPWLNVDTVSLV